MGLNETLNISQKLLVYICENEPIDSISDLISKSKLSEDKIKLNIERLHNGDLIEGHLMKALGSRYFVHINDIRLSYAGLSELKRLFSNQESTNSIIQLNIGEMNFNFTLAKLL